MREKLVPALAAVTLVVCLVAGILYMTRNNAVELKGQVLKVRSHEPDPSSTIVVVDIRVSNPSVQQFVVRDVALKMGDASGRTVDGDIFSEVDVERVLNFYPVLGQKYNQTLMARDKIDPGKSIDRMLAFRLPVSENEVQRRKALRVLVTDVDGDTREILEQR